MQKFILPDIHTLPCTQTITGQDAKHIAKVLRLKPGNSISITNGQGLDFDARIVTCSPKAVCVEIFASKTSVTESDVNITLCCGMLKDKKMDIIIKQATQLGIQQWIPFYCHRSVPKPSASRIENRILRWQTIARESLKQCKRSTIPEISVPLSFDQILETPSESALKMIFWENETRKFIRLEPDENASHIILVIGPEGGFTKEEVKAAANKGFKVNALGPRILRAETAAISACVLAQHLYGDL